MIVARGLSVVAESLAGPVRILEDVEVRAPGRMVGIIGPNGSGKSTLLKVFAGMLQPTGGSFGVGAGDAPLGPPNVAYLPQATNESLWPELTVRETLRLAASRGKIWWAGHRSWDACRREIRWLPPLLATRLDARVETLSGGERQVLALAASLASAPFAGDERDCLIADEFTAALDPKHAELAREALASVLRDVIPTGSLLFVTHSFAELSAFASDVVALAGGRVLWCRPASEVSLEVFHAVFESTT